MKKELEDKLYEKYPKIFPVEDEDFRRYGFLCSDGWYWLIDQLCSSLQFHIDKNSYKQIQALQVKEKFGGLRFYTNNKDNFLRGYISFAESLSMEICEFCGSTEMVGQSVGYIKTICTKCAGRKDD